MKTNKDPRPPQFLSNSDQIVPGSSTIAATQHTTNLLYVDLGIKTLKTSIKRIKPQNLFGFRDLMIGMALKNAKLL
jgi:hypothetical protein